MTTACRSRINLPALHAAYLAEGFKLLPPPPSGGRGAYSCYQRVDEEGIILTSYVPNMPEDDSDLYDYLESVHEAAAAAVFFLWEETGNPHFEIGSIKLAEV